MDQSWLVLLCTLTCLRTAAIWFIMQTATHQKEEGTADILLPVSGIRLELPQE